MSLAADHAAAVPGRDQLKLQAPAEPGAIGQLRHQVVDYATQIGASETVQEAIRLAVSEALTNVVVHAYDGEPGTMTVEARHDGSEQLTVVVLDEGHGLMARPVSPGLGLGLGLMAQMADSFRIASRRGVPGTIVSMRFALS
jgi:serine/threonine-protein kinase RsbW